MGATKKTRREEMNNSKQLLYSILCFSLTLTLLVTASPLGTFGRKSQVLADDTPQKTATGFFFPTSKSGLYHYAGWLAGGSSTPPVTMV